jgi:hypothetical protein
MLEKTASAKSDTDPPPRRTFSDAQTRKRRARNRENMRRRREDPAFRAFEKRRREGLESGLEHDQSFEIALSAAADAAESPRRCSICRKRDAIEVITRLRPCATARSGYVQMRIAYCGFC